MPWILAFPVLGAGQAIRPDSRLFDFSWLGTVSRIAGPIPLAAGLCGLGHRRLVVAHKCPRSCQGMRIPGPPSNQLTLWQAVKPMPSWSFKLEREVFEGV